MNRRTLVAVLVGWLAQFSPTPIVAAQASADLPPAALATGSIAGQIFNPATGEYIRNAHISVEGTNLSTASRADGSYRLANVPAGNVTLKVSYTGYRTETEVVNLPPGQTVTQNFSLRSILQDTAVVELSAFLVSSNREGNAKAIMDQRSSMNITSTVASDVFGDIVEGNVGEFLKNMPGIDLELTQGEIRNVRLRGLDSVYNAVTIDGVSLASTDANNRGADARSFSFEQIALNSIESIEISKTISADVDANAPAGTINLRTKRAFSREGRRISVQANIAGFVDELRLGKSYGPTGGSQRRKVRAGGILEFSDVFFDNRLGIVLNLSHSDLYSETARQTNTYDYAATTLDPRPVVPSRITITNVPRITQKSSAMLTADFKASDNLVLSLSTMYNDLSQLMQVRAVNFDTFVGAAQRAAVTGGDPTTSLTSAGSGRVVLGTGAVGKLGTTYTVIPSFEYRRGNLLLEGRFAGSDSESWYDPHGKHEMLRNVGSPTQSNVAFTAERSSPTSSDWRITQTGGADFATGTGFTSPQFQVNDGRATRAQVYSGELTATLESHGVVPITWKGGVKHKRDIRDFESTGALSLYNYTGPGAGTGAWADFNSPFGFVSDRVGASITSLSGANVFYPDHVLIGRHFNERPEHFTRSLTAANYFSAVVDGIQHYEEDISAGFIMGTADIRRTTVRVGLRWEDTKTKAREPDPLTSQEVQAAGFPVANGRATTIPGIDYQFFTNPKVHRRASYDHFFPSASLKYKIRENLDAHLGYSKTIRRPAPSTVAGVVLVNDVAGTVSVPNRNLVPETSHNFAGRLAYYFEPVGLLGFNVYQNTVKKLHRSSQLTAAEFGYPQVGSDFSPLDLSEFLFNTTIASEERVVIRGMELEYAQSLSFLPGHLRFLNLHANYTRNYAQVVMTGMTPHGINAGISFSHHRLNLYANLNWRGGETPANINRTRFDASRRSIDIGGGVRLTEHFSLFFNGRNITNQPIVTMERIDPHPVLNRTHEYTRAVWTFGIRGVF